MERNGLARLVNDHCQATGDSLATIAERGGLSRQALSGIVNKPRLDVVPRESTLRALARGLGLSFETVRHIAAASAYGSEDKEPQRHLVTTLVAHAEKLDDVQLEVLLATARALRKCPGR